MRQMVLCVTAAVVLGVAVAPGVRAQALNRIAQYASRGGVRGYTCSAWASLAAGERSAFLLGIIALSDALEHGSNDPNFSLTSEDYRALNLPRSANDYVVLVTNGCAQVAATTPVLAVLFSVK